jgi:cytochrome c peroxidase
LQETHVRKTSLHCIALTFLCLLLSQCSKEQTETSGEDSLALKIWQNFQEIEASSQYRESLDAETRLAQQQNMSVIREKIPERYPEPFLPYGTLNNKSLDISLGQKPILNAGIIALGEKLFFDERLSFSTTHGFGAGTSCSSCHLKSRSFSDGEIVSKGVEGDFTSRNSPTLLNAAYNSTLTWANPNFPVLEMQAKIPLFGDDPIELGLKGKEKDLLAFLLDSDPGYRDQIHSVFGLTYPEDFTQGAIDFTLITRALAAYERSLIRFDTRFDKFLQNKLDKSEAFTAAEREGAELFYGFKNLHSGDRLNCAKCHAGITMSNSFQYVRDGVYYNRKSFHNTGLYNLDDHGAYPDKNKGFASESVLRDHPEYMGQFRVPSLRFVGLTAPYGHDGSQASLELVIDHYAAGGRASMEHHGQSPYVDPLIKTGFIIDSSEKSQLIAFLKSLQ